MITSLTAVYYAYTYVNPLLQHDTFLSRFLEQAKNILIRNDLKLLNEIINEWNAGSSLMNLECTWRQHQRKNVISKHVATTHQILCFNVRGLDLRWGEVCLLAKQHRTDILVLYEVGRVDFSLINAAFSDYSLFYRLGENPHEGILILTHEKLSVVRIPNICVLDL